MLLLYGDAETIQNVIAMSFNDHLNPAGSNTRKKFTEHSLAARMDMCFWIFDQNQVTGSR